MPDSTIFINSFKVVIFSLITLYKKFETEMLKKFYENSSLNLETFAFMLKEYSKLQILNKNLDKKIVCGRESTSALNLSFDSMCYSSISFVQ